MPVGDNILKLMQERKISQNRLAKMANISQSGLSSIIHNDVSPKEETVRMIAEALNVSVSELLGEEGWRNELTQQESIAETIYRRPGLRALFDKTKDATEDDINLVLDMLELAKRRSGK